MTWTSNFMINKHITLIIDDDTTFMNKINVDISQNSSIFFIFFLWCKHFEIIKTIMI
jgi:hypothetical protein